MIATFIPHPADALELAHQRGERLRAEAAAERLLGASPARRSVAASLRWFADRLDPAAAAAPQLGLNR
jgi:hypothetical protein